jgi:hypothetical protein
MVVAVVVVKSFVGNALRQRRQQGLLSSAMLNHVNHVNHVLPRNNQTARHTVQALPFGDSTECVTSPCLTSTASAAVRCGSV